MDHPTGGGWDTRQHLGVLPKHHMAGLVEGVGSRGGPGWLPEPWAAPRIPGPGEGGPALQNKRKLGARSFLKKNQKTQPQKTHETDHNVDCSFFGVCVCVRDRVFQCFQSRGARLVIPTVRNEATV